MSEQTYRIPSKIKHDDLMAALKPFCDLLGVNPLEVYPPIVIDPTQVAFSVTARELGDNSPEPTAVPTDGGGVFESPREFAELAIPVHVQVV